MQTRAKDLTTTTSEVYNPMKTKLTTITSPTRAKTGERVLEYPLRNTRTNFDTYTSYNTLSIADTANFKRGTSYGASLPLTDYYLNKTKDQGENDRFD